VGAEIMCKYGTVKNVTVLRQDNVAKVDACLAPLVYLLNQYGIQTITCCCGHVITAYKPQEEANEPK